MPRLGKCGEPRTVEPRPHAIPSDDLGIQHLAQLRNASVVGGGAQESFEKVGARPKACRQVEPAPDLNVFGALRVRFDFAG